MKKIEKAKIYMIVLAIITCLLFSGCSYGNYITQVNFIEEKTVKPEIGILSTTSLGEPIITTGYGHYSKVLEIVSTFSQKDFTGGTMYLEKGSYELIYADKNYEYYKPVNKNLTHYINLYGEDVPEYHNSQIRVSKNNEISIILSNGLIMPGDYTNGLNYKLVDSVFIEKEDSFQQTMIYLGKENDIIKFSYREFSNNLIRDAFTTEISYDLSESTIIGFKKFKAEIINATNSELTYKIISSF